jgi:sulfatase maturation enzyme AslB (radical SAM superfamily)
MPTPAQIRSLEVVLTAGCNLRCSYCYQNEKKPRRMDWTTLRASVDLLLGSEHRDVEVLFLGGEPLLEFALIRRAVEYVEASRPPGLRVRFRVNTNGLLLREDRASFLAEHDFRVQLSFDGVPAAQDLRGRGTFEALDRLLDQLRERHPRFFSRGLSVSITLVAANVRYLADSIDYFLSKQVGEVKISPALTHQADWTSDRITELDEQFGRVFRSSLRFYERTGQVPLALFRKEAEGSSRSPQAGSMCGVDRGESVAVDVDGEVHGCVAFAGSYQVFPTRFLKTRLETMRMGDLRDPGFGDRLAAYPAAVRAARIFHAKEAKRSSYGRCGDCRFLDTCAVCPVSIGHQPGNDDPDRVPDFQCAYNLVSLGYRERFPVQVPLLDLLRRSGQRRRGEER